MTEVPKDSGVKTVSAVSGSQSTRARWNVLEVVPNGKPFQDSFVSGDAEVLCEKGLPSIPGFDSEYKAPGDASDKGAKDPPNFSPPDLNPRRVGTAPSDFSRLVLAAVEALDWTPSTRTGFTYVPVPGVSGDAIIGGLRRPH